MDHKKILVITKDLGGPWWYFQFSLCLSIMRPISRIGIVFYVFSSFLFAQEMPFNQAKTQSIYEVWVNYDTGKPTNDVVNLRGGWIGFSNFCDQIIPNASVVPGKLGKWYIYAYGDHMLSDKTVGDACWMIARNPDGKYDLVPQCHYSGAVCRLPIYVNMEPMLKVEPVPTYEWTYVGWMGQRMAVFYSAQEDARGNHYFALVKVGDLGDPALERNGGEPDDDRHYFVWAVSGDGINWWYEKKNADVSDCLDFDAYLTDVSTEARPILYRECFQSDTASGQRSNEVFHHYALFYSDPAKQDIYGNSGDGYLYVISGYTPSGAGIHNIGLRIPFSLNSCIGRDLTKHIQIYRDDEPTGDSPYCPGEGRWEDLNFCPLPDRCNSLIVPSDYPGCIPLEFEQSFRSALFNEFIPGLAVPFDWITLLDRWGNFYGSILAYDSGHSFGGERIAVRFTRDIKPPFHWSDEREINTCPIPKYIQHEQPGYSACEAGGNNVALYQPPYGPGFTDYYDSETGAPKKLIAFFAEQKKTDARPSCGHTSCNYERGGLLPATIELTSLPSLEEVQQVKVFKAAGGKLSVTWETIPGAEGYEILEGTLGRYGPGGTLQPFGYPFNPDGYPNGTPCPEKVKYDHYRKCPWKDSNNNCCTWRIYHGGDSPWHECCNDTSCLGTPATPITSPPVHFYPESEGARYILVSSYCHRYDQEDYGFSSAGIERLAPMCSPITCIPEEANNYCSGILNSMQSNIDCYHFYYQGSDQPYNYGLNHWPQLP